MDNSCSEPIAFEETWSLLCKHSEVLVTDAHKEALDMALQSRPQLKSFIAANGSLPLPEYGKKIASTAGTISQALQTTVHELIRKYHGEDAAQRLAPSLKTLSSIDTSGHGGILSEDTLIQSHAVIASGIKGHGIQSFLGLACGVVPMNNSTWPRGYFVSGERESIFPKSFDRMAFHECAPFTKEMLNKKLSDAATSQRAKEILERIALVPHIFDQKKFFGQTTLINHSLWNGEISSGGTPEYFQLMLEEVTSELVIRSIEADDALSKLIFCKDNRDLFFSELSELPGTWSKDKKKGTFLFWHSSGDFRAASLFPDKESLSNGQITIPFTEDGIVSALQSRTIVPSVFLSLVALLHHGVRPLGGYHQIWYLPEYTVRLARFASQVPLVACPNFLENIRCSDLFQLGYGFAYLRDPESPQILAGLDSFINRPRTKDALWTTLQGTTVATAVLSNINRWYTELVPASKRTVALS